MKRCINTTITANISDPDVPEPLVQASSQVPPSARSLSQQPSAQSQLHGAPPDAPELSPSTTRDPPNAVTPFSESVRQLLPLLKAQSPHYISAHIHSRPYLITAGDTLRLPFLMPDVSPGDILRLNRATVIGSRDYTLKSASSLPTPQKLHSPGTTQVPNQSTPNGRKVEDAPSNMAGADTKHKEPKYLDERLFVCRAVVLGTEAEPMRIKEKTKRRQRRVKTVHSKHKFTILKIKELEVRSLEDIEDARKTALEEPL